MKDMANKRHSTSKVKQAQAWSLPRWVTEIPGCGILDSWVV